MAYVDGFVLALPKDKIDAYTAFSRKTGEVWMEHGAITYVECIGDDVPHGEVTSFPRAVQAKDDEVVLWTHAELVAARRIYAALGFAKTQEWRHADFGPVVVSETWRLAL